MKKWELELRSDGIRNLLNEVDLHIKYGNLEGVDELLKQIAKDIKAFRANIKEEII